MFNPFAPKRPTGGGSNFDPLQQAAAVNRKPPAVPPRATASPVASASEAPAASPSSASRDGPLLLRIVDDLAQAALKARNDFMLELNSADAQRRDVHAAARARLEQELSQMASTASKLSDRLFFATRGVLSLARGRREHCAACASADALHTQAPQAPALQAPPPQDARAPPSPTPEPSAGPAAAAAPVSEDTDLEVARVNHPALAMQEEIARLRAEHAQTRLQERAEVRPACAAPAAARLRRG